MSTEIVEVIRRSKQGMTRPFICRGDDGLIYYVKGIDAGRRSQICEWVAGRLGSLYGLPIAPFKIVEVPEELLEIKTSLDLTGLGVGPAFGSQEQYLTELNYSGIEQVPENLQQDVLLFDWWVRNGDRCLSEQGGNPNLFWQPGYDELVVIDHNQAFDFKEERKGFFERHVFSNKVRELSSDFFRRDEYNIRLTNALNSWPQIISEIPDSWWYVDAEMTVPVDFDKDAVYELLKGFEREEFWI